MKTGELTTMRKIKIFTDNNYRLIEEQVNLWLVNHKAAVIHNILQSECELEESWSRTITIFYYEGEQGA